MRDKKELKGLVPDSVKRDIIKRVSFKIKLAEEMIMNSHEGNDIAPYVAMYDRIQDILENEHSPKAKELIVAMRKNIVWMINSDGVIVHRFLDQIISDLSWIYSDTFLSLVDEEDLDRYEYVNFMFKSLEDSLGILANENRIFMSFLINPVAPVVYEDRVISNTLTYMFFYDAIVNDYDLTFDEILKDSIFVNYYEELKKSNEENGIIPVSKSVSETYSKHDMSSLFGELNFKDYSIDMKSLSELMLEDYLFVEDLHGIYERVNDEKAESIFELIRFLNKILEKGFSEFDIFKDAVKALAFNESYESNSGLEVMMYELIEIKLDFLFSFSKSLAKRPNEMFHRKKVSKL